jgi:pimeloyl-ACP methyl ester carboxylesterase
MGCGFSDDDWQEEMERLELQMYMLAGCEAKFLTRKYTTIKFDGSDFAVRTIIYSDGEPRKTLVMTHGYGISTAFFCKTLVPLSKHYKIVMFDNLGWGLNTRV